jgi:hypothetical protein
VTPGELRPRERCPPRMPNQLPPWLEDRVVAFSLGQPRLGRGGSPSNSPSRCGAGCRSRPAGSSRCSRGSSSAGKKLPVHRLRICNSRCPVPGTASRFQVHDGQSATTSVRDQFCDRSAIVAEYGRPMSLNQEGRSLA